MRFFFKKPTAIAAAISFLLLSTSSSVSHAQDSEIAVPEIEKVTSIKIGEIAPFSGTLFSTSAAARLLADLETRDTLCDIICAERLEIQKATLQFKIDVSRASFDALQLKYDETLKIKDDQIVFLERQVKRPKISKDVYFVVGVLSGVALTMGSAYAIGQAANH